MKNNDDEKIKFQKIMEEFRNRKIFKELSLEILVETPEDKLEQVIIDCVEANINDFEMVLDIVSKMLPGFQTIYSTWVFEWEVRNGGFNQFFYNSSSQFAEMALNALETLNAIDYYEILSNAIKVHLKEKGNLNLQNLYSQKTLSAFFESYKFTSLDECDGSFFKLNKQKPLSNFRIRYIRLHPEYFVEN